MTKSFRYGKVFSIMSNMKISPLRLAILESQRTQRDIAAEAGLSESRLSLIVNGHWNADEVTRERIASALDKTPDVLWPSTELAA